MFYLISFIDSCKYMLILNLMPETSLDKGNERLGKVWNAPKTSVWNIPQEDRFSPQEARRPQARTG